MLNKIIRFSIFIFLICLTIVSIRFKKTVVFGKYVHEKQTTVKTDYQESEIWKNGHRTGILPTNISINSKDKISIVYQDMYGNNEIAHLHFAENPVGEIINIPTDQLVNQSISKDYQAVIQTTDNNCVLQILKKSSELLFSKPIQCTNEIGLTYSSADQETILIEIDEKIRPPFVASGPAVESYKTLFLYNIKSKVLMPIKDEETISENTQFLYNHLFLPEFSADSSWLFAYNDQAPMLAKLQLTIYRVKDGEKILTVNQGKYNLGYCRWHFEKPWLICRSNDGFVVALLEDGNWIQRLFTPENEESIQRYSWFGDSILLETKAGVTLVDPMTHKIHKKILGNSIYGFSNDGNYLITISELEDSSNYQLYLYGKNSRNPLKMTLIKDLPYNIVTSYLIRGSNHLSNLFHFIENKFPVFRESDLLSLYRLECTSNAFYEIRDDFIIGKSKNNICSSPANNHEKKICDYYGSLKSADDYFYIPFSSNEPIP